MFFTNRCVLVLWTKVASTLEGLTVEVSISRLPLTQRKKAQRKHLNYFLDVIMSFFWVKLIDFSQIHLFGCIHVRWAVGFKLSFQVRELE